MFLVETVRFIPAEPSAAASSFIIAACLAVVFCKQKTVYLLRTSNTSMLEYIIQII